MEFLQGKRIADGEGGYQMSDMYHENTMLSTENENLRLRIKSLQETIDAQTQQIAEIKAAAVLGKLGEGKELFTALWLIAFCVVSLYLQSSHYVLRWHWFKFLCRPISSAPYKK